MKFRKFECEKEYINGVAFERPPVLDCHVLLQRRKEMNLTQQQVSQAAGIQLRQYQRLESGESSFSGSSARIVLSVCEVLQLDPYLFFGKGNEDTDDTVHDVYVVLPMIETKLGPEGRYRKIPELAYYIVVSAIPYGMVCTEEEIWDKLKEVYGVSHVEVVPDHNCIPMYRDAKFPFWRAVSDNGNITGSIHAAKDQLVDFLKMEGHNVRKVGDTSRYRLMDFKTTHYNIHDMKIFVLQTEDQMMEAFQKVSSIKDNNR